MQIQLASLQFTDSAVYVEKRNKKSDKDKRNKQVSPICYHFTNEYCAAELQITAESQHWIKL